LVSSSGPIAIVLILTNITFMGSLAYIWSSIYTLQVLSFLPLAKLRSPNYFNHFMAKMNFFDFKLGYIPDRVALEYPVIGKLILWGDESIDSTFMNYMDQIENSWTYLAIALLVALLGFIGFILAVPSARKTIL
jgi:hypothetical protein